MITFNSFLCLIIALLPFLVSISVPFIPSLYFSDIALVFLFFVLLLGPKKEIVSNNKLSIKSLRFFSFLVFASYLLGKITFSFFFDYQESSGIWGLFIFFITTLIIIPYGQSVIGGKSIQRIVVFISLVAFIGLIIQYAAFYFGGGFVKLIPLELYSPQVQELYGQVAFTGVKNGLFRPSSIFLEPAQYSEYCVIAVASLLFSKNKNRKWSIIAGGLITLGIFMTTSALGVVLSSVIWIFYFFKYKKNKLQSVAVILALSISLSIFLPQTDFFNTIVNRTFISEGSGNAIYARGNYYFILFELNPLHQLFGIGYGLEQGIYMPAMAKYLLRLGLFGSGLFLFLVFRHYKKLDSFGKIMCFVWFLTFVAADISGVYYLVFYFLLIFGSQKEKLMIQKHMFRSGASNEK